MVRKNKGFQSHLRRLFNCNARAVPTSRLAEPLARKKIGRFRRQWIGASHDETRGFDRDRGAKAASGRGAFLLPPLARIVVSIGRFLDYIEHRF